MAYAATVSLKNTIRSLLPSSLFSGKQIEHVYMGVVSLQEFLEKILYLPRIRERIHVWETQIADVIYKLEDSLLSCGSVEQDITSFLETAKKIKEEYYAIGASHDSDSLPVVDDRFSSRNYRFEENITKFVGLGDDKRRLMELLFGQTFRLRIVSIVGMVGVGKTALAKQVYNIPLASFHFGFRVFVRIGQRYSVREILLEILAQICSRVHVDELHDETADLIGSHLYKILMNKKYLIVLDDIWSIEIWDEIRRIFPDDNNGSRILITTTSTQVAAYMDDRECIHQMRFLNGDESWDLLRQVVFGEETCPSELEKIGKKIAQNCQGLPLDIILIGRLLSKAEKTLEYWKTVGETQNLHFTGGDDTETFKMLHLRYENLPQHLKVCFLYVGVFPQNSEIPASKLIQLWVAEGFLELKEDVSLEEVAEKCLKELADRSLVIVHERSSIGRIKTCRVHPVVRKLCVNEAEKYKFFHVINRYQVNGCVNSQHRMCIHKNIVFGIKEMHELVASATNVRSLLCYGTINRYPLPVCLEFKLLRVLDVLTIRFYNFPDAILKLIQLRYLALNFNGELPASISRLGKLQVLIVRLHQRIKSSGSTPSYLPMEIWDMKELRHLQFLGSDLPNPYDADQLSSLVTLSDLSAQSCTKRILESIGQLKKLGVRIELVPSLHAAEPLCPFDHLALLDRLESFKCVVVNPNFGYQIIKLPNSSSIFPVSLKKITLRGCGFPWKDMKIISGLPYLEVLKLGESAFQGPEWEMLEEKFCQLKFLMLESMDLVHWRANESHFPFLESLILKHCYQLEEIPLEIVFTGVFRLIELVHCSSSAEASARQIEQELEYFGDPDFRVRVTQIDSSL